LVSVTLFYYPPNGLIFSKNILAKTYHDIDFSVQRKNVGLSLVAIKTTFVLVFKFFLASSQETLPEL
jgi:hypothetical protein